jgi:predicted HicB family RNase H-like nuclease
MPQQLHRRLSLEAECEGISLNQWINAKLSGRR